MQATVSVILPTYDRLAFVPAAIESVFAQTFKGWELIIADDGSSHATASYLRTLEHLPRVRIVWLTHSGRPARVRNAALRQATGEFVAFLDSDDLWQPNKLEMQIAALQRDSSRRWSYTRFALIDSAGDAIARPQDWPMMDGWVLEHLLRDATVIAPSTVLASGSLLQQVGGFDEQFVACEDYELWLRLAAVSPIASTDVPLTLLRRHGQHSSNDMQCWFDRRRAIDKVMADNATGPLRPLLRRTRARMSVGLALSEARSGQLRGAFGTLLRSLLSSWRYALWWRGALRTTAVAARALTPATARRFLRTLRVPL